MSQLTITLDDSLLQAAQVYARQHGQELNTLVARLLAEVVQPTAAVQSARPFSPRVQRLFGAVQAPADFDYKQVLQEAIQERFKP